MPFNQALILALLQGATELFPVSSLGHAVLLPSLLHWSYQQSDRAFLPFLTLLHLGTATALLILFWRTWWRVAVAFFRLAIRGRIETPDERLAMLLIVGTIPTGAIGVAFKDRLTQLFAAPRAAAVLLLVNAAILFGAELLRRRRERELQLEDREKQEAAFADMPRLPYRAALLIGLCQSLALLPGISRSGATLAGGLLAGLRHQEAARFSFLLATHIIAAAGLFEVPVLFSAGVPLGEYLLAAVAAGVAAYISARFLVRYFRTGRLDPYAAYCAALGVVSLVLLR